MVVSDEKGRVKIFQEKPVEFIGNKINAGIYIFNTSIIDRIELKPHFLERDIFPKLAQQDEMRSLLLNGFWMDIGQPKDFLTCTQYYLNHLKELQT